MDRSNSNEDSKDYVMRDQELKRKRERNSDVEDRDRKKGKHDEDEIDPLDAYMNSMVIPKVTNTGVDQKRYEVEDEDDDDDDELMKRVTKTEVKMNYIDFRKNLYIEVKEIQRMGVEEVAAYRKNLQLKILGEDVPKPIKTWYQTGLSTKILETIKRMNYNKPTSIQAQALPVIMSGRDCICVSKPSSGKTLAFLLPMLRHIMDQPKLEYGDGPIGLIMAPTQYLVDQIYTELRKFTKVLGLYCVAAGTTRGVGRQLKKGAEILVCTPDRMVDFLCMKITNLTRVSYVVIDEADRMFDWNFEPQITRIVQNTQPKCQTVVLSCKFTIWVEDFTQRVLNKPVLIQVGGRNVVNKDISQLVEVSPQNERFSRLLDRLVEWYGKGNKILIFVESQERCAALFRDLLKHGYPCLSLDGWTNWESTLSDFRSNNKNVCNLLIATSISIRDSDVKGVQVVINYDVAKCYQDYLDRVDRTGRNGYAVTFLSPEDEKYAPHIVKALELSNQIVPDNVRDLAELFIGKIHQQFGCSRRRYSP